jgi:hypothetical protein
MCIRYRSAATARPARPWRPRGVPTDLETTRRPHREDRAQQQAEIEPAGMDQQPLEDVRVTAQVGAAHTPGVIEVRERAFDQFAAPPHETPSAFQTRNIDLTELRIRSGCM